ncbi:MAG: serine/threonine protein kinase [Tannerella sp.]|jgi:serine/threonine-protein kinase|nr:serine/threonine protein kinase [Tannerella sp.]
MHLPKGYYLQDKKYQLAQVIGQGGFGITYMGAWSTEVKGELGRVRTDVPVCIKEYFFKDYCFRDSISQHVRVHSKTGQALFDKFKEKLIKEAKILSEVHHPFVVNVLEVFEENNTAYIAMEHIQGCSLKYMLDTQGILPEMKVLKYICQIGQALDFVHRKNILHLDIKPSNILIDKRNNARLIDFGVSKRYDMEQQETSTTMLTLSKGFASIEQYDSEGIQSFSPCPDIYSLGATMYNLLTGIVPIESILRATKPLPRPSEVNKEITSKTEEVILRAMRINPAERYQTVRAMINELDIPSYFEETENTLREISPLSSSGDDDSTAHVSRVQRPVDPEQTEVKHTDTFSKRIRKKKRKRRITSPLAIFIFAFVGYAVTYMFGLNESSGTAGDTKGIILPQSLLPEMNPETTTEEAPEKTDAIVTPPQTSLSAGSEKTANRKEKTPEQSVVEPQRTQDMRPEEITPSLEEINEKYNALVASGKEKMEQKKYTEAKQDFEKAHALKTTPEVSQLYLECSEKEEEQKIAERKALYEMKMSLGNYTVVRKISTQLYGAIDSKGIERIKCIYVNTGYSSANNGRAFEREDGKYDIYKADGEQIGYGVDNY